MLSPSIHLELYKIYHRQKSQEYFVYENILFVQKLPVMFLKGVFIEIKGLPKSSLVHKWKQS